MYVNSIKSNIILFPKISILIWLHSSIFVRIPVFKRCPFKSKKNVQQFSFETPCQLIRNQHTGTNVMSMGILNSNTTRMISDLKNISWNIQSVIQSLLSHEPSSRMELEMVIDKIMQPLEHQQSVEKTKMSLARSSVVYQLNGVNALIIYVINGHVNIILLLLCCTGIYQGKHEGHLTRVYKNGTKKSKMLNWQSTLTKDLGTWPAWLSLGPGATKVR